MKTLKKTLCLVLALVMAFSLMSVAFAGNFDNYTDADKVGDAYVEAVDVLLGLGIVNGDSATTLSPQGYYTREQAAKIATYLAVGPKVADLLSTDKAPFGDVKADRWSAGYIAYCARENILNGVGDLDGDGVMDFDPTGYVTGYQFAKMILAAAGYGALDEFTGSGWEISVAQLALSADINLFEGDASAATSKPITREQAMLIAFNALDDSFELVSYSKLLEMYVPTEETFNSKNFEVEKSTPAPNDDGLTVYTWQVDGKDISDSYILDTFVGTFTAGTAYGDIATAIGVTDKTAETVKVYEWTNQDAGSSYNANTLVDGTGTIYGYDTLDVYKTPEGNFKFLYTEEYLAKAELGSMITTGDDKGKYTWTFTCVEIGDTENSWTVNAAKDAYTDDAIYSVVPNYDYASGESELLSAALADSVQGVVTAKGNNYVKLGSDKYLLETDVIEKSDFTIGNEYVLYFYSSDYVGYAAAPSAVETPDTLVFVVDHYSKRIPAEYDAYGNTVPGTGVTQWYAQCVDMNGEEVSYLVASEVGGNEGKLLKVTYNSSDKVYTFADSSYVVSAATIANGRISFAVEGTNYYYNNAEYVSIVGSLDKLTVSAGTLKAADANDGAWAVFSGTGANKTISKVFYFNATAPEIDATYSYAMLATGADCIEETSVMRKNATVETPVYVYEVYINGEKTEVKTYESSLPADFYKYAVDEYGVYEVVELDGVHAAVENIYGSYITVAGLDDKYDNYDISGIRVVDLTEDGDGKIAAGEYVAFYATVNADDTVTIECIYIVDAPSV